MRARRCPRTCFVDDEAPRRLGRQRRIAVEAPHRIIVAHHALCAGPQATPSLLARVRRRSGRPTNRPGASAPRAFRQRPQRIPRIHAQGRGSAGRDGFRGAGTNGGRGQATGLKPHGARDRREINPRDLSGVRFPQLDSRERTGGNTHLRRSEVIGASRAWPKEERPLWRRLAREADGLLSTQHGRPDASPLCPKPDARPTLGDEGSRDPGCCHRTLHRSPAGSHRSYVAW